MAQTTSVLITGTKSGIGRALLEAYALRPNHTVIAAIRDAPTSSAAQTLTSLPVGAGSTIIAAQYDAASPAAADDLVSSLSNTISHLDIVIANAGLLAHSGKIRDTLASDYEAHFRINTIAPLLLYKATAALLHASPAAASAPPKFVVVSSSLGSNGLQDSYGALALPAYSISKAAVNWAVGKIHREEDRIVALALQPGWVRTPMGEKAARYAGMTARDVPVAVEDAAEGLLAIVDRATKEAHSGRFWDGVSGEELPW